MTARALQPPRPWTSLALLAGLLTPAWAGMLPVLQQFLWQERTYWDGLLGSRDRAARESADPNLLPVVRAIADQTALQAANLREIAARVKEQRENLRFAFGQNDPSRSLATIQGNIETLARGTRQVKSNLYYLTVRCRMASSQALPDPQLAAAASALLREVQAIQPELDSVHASAAAVRAVAASENWLRDGFVRYNADLLARSAAQAQDAALAVRQSAYELYARSR